MKRKPKIQPAMNRIYFIIVPGSGTPLTIVAPSELHAFKCYRDQHGDKHNSSILIYTT